MSDDQTPQAKGGHARAAALSPSERKEVAKAGAAARWGNPNAMRRSRMASLKRMKRKFIDLADDATASAKLIDEAIDKMER